MLIGVAVFFLAAITALLYVYLKKQRKKRREVMALRKKHSEEVAEKALEGLRNAALNRQLK